MSVIVDFLSKNSVYALGWTVVHALWQGTLIACLMSLVLWGLPIKQAQQRYWVACGALLAVLLAAIATFIRVLPDTPNTTDDGLSLTLIYAENAFLTPQEGPLWMAFVAQIQTFFNTHLTAIVVTWLVGVALFATRLVGGLLYIGQLRHDAQPLPALWQGKIHVFKHKLGIKTAIWVAESTKVAAPMVIGWLKPLILLPVGLVNQMSVTQVEAILAHELAHVAGRDYLVNMLQSLVETLFYYHPAVWWISATIRAERENRCDDTAIALGGNALVYAKALLSVQEQQHRLMKSAGLALSASGPHKGSLLKRVKRILNQSHNKSSIMEKLTATGLLLAVVTALSFNNYNRAATPPPTPSVPLPKTVLVNVLGDSLPNKQIIIRRDDKGEGVEMQLENGTLKKLSVNGKEVPAAEFGKYDAVVKSMMSELPPPPPPPPAPGTPPPPPLPPGQSASLIYNIDKNKDSARIVMKKSIIIDGKVITEDWKGVDDLDNMVFNGDSLVKKIKSMDVRVDGNNQKIFIWTDEQLFKKEGMPLFKEGQFQALEAEQLHRQAEVLRRQAEDMRQQADRLREQSRKQAEAARNEGAAVSGFNAADGLDEVAAGLRNELAKDGLIRGRGRGTKFSLTDDALSINGVEQPKSVYEKYVKLYQSLSKEKLKKQFNITIYF